MSNKVYGFCEAGCRYRVPTYDEYEKSAAFIPVEADENGRFKIEVGKKYRIFASTNTSTKVFKADLCPSYTDGVIYDTLSGLFPYNSVYEESFTLQVLRCVYGLADDGYTTQCAIHYLYNGTAGIEYFVVDTSANSTPDFIIVGAKKVMLINEDAEITLTVDTDIVVPDTSTSKRGTAGLVYMYNESSGLRLDNDKRLCIAPASKSDIDAGTSNNKPIVPAYMKYAMQSKSFTDDISNIIESSPDAKTPAGALAIKDFVFNNALNFKLHKIPRGETFKITPGMMALILPYGDYTLSAHKSDGTTVASSMGATIVMATDWGADADNANNYWVAFMYVKSATLMPTMSSNHNAYTANCYIKNNDSGTDGSGIAYVYYLSRPTEA